MIAPYQIFCRQLINVTIKLLLLEIMATNWLDDCTIHNILQVTFYMTLKILLLVLLSMNWLMDCRIPNVVYILLATFYMTSGNCWKTSFPNEKVYKWIGKKMKTWTKTETSINGKPGLTVCVCVCEWSTYKKDKDRRKGHRFSLGGRIYSIPCRASYFA